jgi:hypothetical protein
VVYGYFDGSGSHTEAQVCIISGFVAEADAWVDFGNRWQAVLNKPGWPNRPRELHTVDCAHGEGGFAAWSFPQRLALIGDCINVLIDSPRIFPIGSAVVPDALLQLPIVDLQLLTSNRLGTPLELGFQHLMQRVINRTYERWPKERVALMLDNDQNEALYHSLYNEYAQRFPRGERLEQSLQFGDSASFPPIQAADLLSYTTLQWQMKRNFGTELDFPIIPAFMRMVKGMIENQPDGGGYDLESLQKLLAAMKRGERLAPRREGA